MMDVGQLAAEVLERGEGVFVLDSEFRFLLVNEAFERAAGITRGEILGRVLWDVYPDAASPDSKFFHEYHRAMRERIVVRFDETYAQRGTWNEITVYPTQAGGLAVFFRNITKRRAAEAALAQETERYRSLFQHSVDAVYLALTDGTILDANPAACRLHGMTLEEIKRAGRSGLVVNDERHAAAVRERALAGQVRAEMTVRRKDGSTLPVEVESVVIDPARADSPAFVISRDITERKRAEEALLASERALRAAHERLRVHVESTPLALVEWDSEYRVAHYSRRAEEVFGWTAAEVVGKRIDEIPWIPEEDWPSVRAVMHDMSTGARSTNVNANRNVRKDGRLLYCEWYNSTIHDDAGRLVSVLSLVLDVTARREAEQQLLETNQRLLDADRRKDEFLGMLSHELRNPLAPIRSSIYVLRHADPAGDQARRAREIIERQTEHLTHLVDDLLDVTRIARGKIELRRTRIDLRDVVARAADDFRLLMRDRGVQFDIAVPDEPLWSHVDATRITQVVGNLLHNASKFTRRGDTIALSMCVLDSVAEVSIRDTGAGIDAELLPRVFDPFTQAERTLARSEGGLGLGLALVKGIAELHGGTVEARSAGQGSGSEFIVCFPLLPSPEAAPDGAPRVERGNGGRRVLVVDGNADAAETMADVLGMLGHAVEVAHDGPSAVAKARANPPDIILCDIGLPGMSSSDVAQVLRRQGIQAQLFATSGDAQPDDVERAIAAGFDGHLATPPTLDDLERILA
jgi:PAS domain S-box-containing protein